MLPGVSGRVALRSQRYEIAKLHSKGRILYDSCEGVPGNPAQRDSTPVGRQVVRCLSGGPTGLPGAVPLTASAEPSCETRPPCGLRGRRPTGRSGRPHPDSNRRRGGAAGGRAGFSRRVPGVRSTRRYPAARGRSRVPYQRLGLPARCCRGLRECRDPKSAARARRSAILHSKGRILYDRAKGCLETQPKGTRLRSSGRCSGICRAAPRDYQAQSHPFSPPKWGRPRWRV